MSNFILYSDGACSGNPGPGGWGYVVVTDKGETFHEECGYDVSTTSNAMELRGVSHGLEFMLDLMRHGKLGEGPHTVTVRSDSEYIVNGFRKRWIDKWRRNGWKTARGRHVANYPEWLELAAAVSVLREVGAEVSFEHVPGHFGEPLNERADQLAVEGRSIAATKRLNSEL